MLINQDLSSPPFTFPTPLPCPVPDIAMIVLNCGTEEYLTSMQGCRFAFKYNYWLYLYWQIDRCCTQYYIVRKFKEMLRSKPNYCQTPVLCLGLGVDFTFAWDNHNNHNQYNPHLNFVKGPVLGDKEQGLRIAIRDKGQRIRDKT